MIRRVIDLLKRFVAWALSWFRRTEIGRTEIGGDVASYDDEGLIAEYVADVAIGRSPESIHEAVRDGYEKLSRKGVKPPYRVVEIWAHGTNPFTEFRVILKGD